MERIVCVGENSQGKTHYLAKYHNDNKEKSVYIQSEQKADNELRNTADSSELMKFLNSLIIFEDLEESLSQQLQGLMSDFDNHERIMTELEVNFSSLKNIVNVQTRSNRNYKEKPGSGDRFLSQLMILEHFLSKTDGQAREYNTLIIDEPERHFHLSMHYELGVILKNISKKGIKVIAASHSPEFVKGFIEDLEEIYYFKDLKYISLKKTNEYLKLLTNKNYYGPMIGQMSKFWQKLFSDDDYLVKYFNIFIREELIHSLFAPKIFLGEGYAEKMMYNLYIDQFPGDYFFFQTNGKIIMPWIIEVIKLIDDKKEIVVMYDMDNEGQKLHKICNDLLQKMSDITRVVSEENIEQRLKLTSKNKVRELSIELLNCYYKDDPLVMEYIKEMNGDK